MTKRLDEVTAEIRKMVIDDLKDMCDVKSEQMRKNLIDEDAHVRLIAFRTVLMELCNLWRMK